MQSVHYLSTTYIKVLLRANQSLEAPLSQALGQNVYELLKQDYIYGEKIDRMFGIFTDIGLESWVLQFGEQLNIASHGPLGFAVLSAADLQTAVSVLADYTLLRSSAYRFEFIKSDNRITLILHSQWANELIARWMIESGLHVLQQLITTIMSHELGTQANITLAYPKPRYSNDLEMFYGIPCEFNAPQNTLSFPASWGRITSPLADAATFDSNLLKCQELKLALSNTHTITESVRLSLQTFFTKRINGNDIKTPLPSIDDLAQKHTMSPRTFTRKLSLEGESYKALLAEVRRQQATKLLKNTHLSVADIAFYLNYQEPANFIRAFKHWFATTPNVWRRRP